MVAFIDAHQKDFGVEPIFAQLPIASSTYYAAKACDRDPSRRSARARGDFHGHQARRAPGRTL
jgi:putative transposase